MALARCRRCRLHCIQ